MSDKDKLENWLVSLRFTEVCNYPKVESEEAKRILNNFAINFQEAYSTALNDIRKL